MYREDRGLAVTSVRPMNAYGPRQSAPEPYGNSKVRKIVPSFVCSALSGVPMPVYGDGSQISDSVYVGDVAKVFVKALEEAANGNVPNHPIDVGNLIPTSVLDVAKMVQKFVPNSEIEFRQMRAGEPFGGALNTQDKLLDVVDAISRTNPDLDRKNIRRVTRELGTVVSADVTTLESIGVDYKNFVTLEDGIQETVSWFREQEYISWTKPSK